MKTLHQFDWMTEELTQLKGKDLYRKLRVLEEIKGTSALLDGKKISLFCGNDYLGLSQHPKLIETAEEALKTYGVGAASARLISGTTTWHQTLEDRIARFFGKEKALLFSSGYLANLGALSALTRPEDLIILDKLSHASLIDAAKLSGAQTRIYPHKNLDYLEKILRRTASDHISRAISSPLVRQKTDESVLRRMGEEKGGGNYPPYPNLLPWRGEGMPRSAGRVWIVTDSVFSMDGDLAPLPELVELKNRYGAYLVIDEAHATGVFGASGRGVSEHFGVSDEIDVHIGTLSKAVGTFGGFVTGRGELIDYLINHARPFIFETALPPSLCAAAVEAFNLMDQSSEFRNRLWRNVKRLKDGLQAIGAPLLQSESPIIPLVFWDEKKTLEASEFLLQNGFLIPAARYPTVPKGKARLRVTLSAAHSEIEIDRLIAAFTPLDF